MPVSASRESGRRRLSFSISPVMILLGLGSVLLLGAVLALFSAIAARQGLILENTHVFGGWFGRRALFFAGLIWMCVASIGLVPVLLGRRERGDHGFSQRLLKAASGAWTAETVIDRLIAKGFEAWATRAHFRAPTHVFSRSVAVRTFLPALPIVAWIAWLMHVNPPNHDYSDTFPVALWRLGEFNLVPGSLYEAAFPQLLTALPLLLAWGSRVLSIDLGSLYAAVTAVSVGLGLVGVAWAARTLADSPWAALAAVLVFPGTWLATLIVGYSMTFWDCVEIAGHGYPVDSEPYNIL